MKKEETTAE